MSYHVEYSDTALKQLKKMDRFDARLITSWIGKNLEGCSDPPHPRQRPHSQPIRRVALPHRQLPHPVHHRGWPPHHRSVFRRTPL